MAFERTKRVLTKLFGRAVEEAVAKPTQIEITAQELTNLFRPVISIQAITENSEGPVRDGIQSAIEWINQSGISARYKEADTLKRALQDIKGATPLTLSNDDIITISVDTLNDLAASVQAIDDAGSAYKNQDKEEITIYDEDGGFLTYTPETDGPDLTAETFVFNTTPNSSIITPDQKANALFQLSDKLHNFLGHKQELLSQDHSPSSEQTVPLAPQPYNDPYNW